MLAKQGRFAESVDHYRDSISIAKTLHDDLLLSYSLLNLANSLWRLGRDPEAADLLAQLTAMADRPGSPNKDMLARVRLTEANMALSRDRFDEVASKGGEALARVGVDRREHVYWAARATLARRPEDGRRHRGEELGRADAGAAGGVDRRRKGFCRRDAFDPAP